MHDEAALRERFPTLATIPPCEGMKVYREQPSGAIVPVMPFDGVETALDVVISSHHGQPVSLFVSDALCAFSIRSVVAARPTEASKRRLDTIVREHRSKFVNAGFIL